MKTRIRVCILFIIFCLTISTKTTFASSSYVLPYPGTMPGTIFYKLHLVEEFIQKYWYFGNFGQFDYNLKQSDKYLVEAKTLFEYKQYLLGYNALLKSNDYFIKISPSFSRAATENKDISEKKKILIAASEKHVEVLGKMITEIPSDFTWRPEKGNVTKLPLHDAIRSAIEIRQKNI